MSRRRVSNFQREGFPSYEEIDEEGQAKPCVYGIPWVNEDTLRTMAKHGDARSGPKGEPIAADSPMIRSR